MVVFTVQISIDFSCQIPLLSRVMLRVGCLSQLYMTDSSHEIMGINSFQLSLVDLCGIYL